MKNNQQKSERGGKRPGAGRPKGSLNKATADIREAAQVYTGEALEKLAEIMRAGESEAARVAAIRELLDRGHGKPRQSLEVEADVKATITRIERQIVRPQHSDS